jgi:hypothetical protein
MPRGRRGRGAANANNNNNNGNDGNANDGNANVGQGVNNNGLNNNAGAGQLPLPPFLVPAPVAPPRLRLDTLPLLKRDNFHDWFFSLQSMFAVFGWLSLLTEPRPGNPPVDPTVTAQAKMLINPSLQGSDRGVLRLASTIWECVKELRERCLGRAPVTKADLCKAIWRYEAKPGCTITSIIEDIRMYAEQLSIFGQMFGENELAIAACTAIKANLPQYVQHVDNYMTNALGDLSLKGLEDTLQPLEKSKPGQVAGAFIAQSQSAPSTSSAPEVDHEAIAALVAAKLSSSFGNGRGRGRGYYRGGRGARGGRGGARGVGRNNNQGRYCTCCHQMGHTAPYCHVVCNTCGGRGHKWQNCPTGASGSGDNRGRGRGGGKGGGKGANGRANAAFGETSSEGDA